MTLPTPTGPSSAYILPGLSPVATSIIRVCCEVHGVSVVDVTTSRSRVPTLIDARYQSAFMVEAMTGMAPADVAHLFGLRDHAAMNYIRRRTIDLWDADKKFRNDLYETGWRLGKSEMDTEELVEARRRHIKEMRRPVEVRSAR